MTAPLMLAACRPSEIPPMLEPLASPKKRQAAEHRVNAAIPAKRKLQTSFEARGAVVEPTLAPTRGTAAAETGDITLHLLPCRVLAACYDDMTATPSSPRSAPPMCKSPLLYRGPCQASP